MRKRSPVVVLSSDDDERTPTNGNDALIRRGSAGRCRPRSSQSRPSPSASKRTRVGRTSKRGRRLSAGASRDVGLSGFDNISEDCCEYLRGFNLKTGFTCMDRTVLWTDKHRPHSLVELALHRKKVEEIERWLQERMMTSKEYLNNYVLLITGQAGVGKSTVIQVFASKLGANLCEWMTPTPTLWQEYVYNSTSGVRYMSKLEEFEKFVETVRKYSLLNLSPSGESRKPTILLIDDLPVANGRGAFGRLTKCLTDLVHSARLPTVILITEYHKTEYSQMTNQHQEELESCLQRAGAYKVALNPITVNSTKRTLARICQVEGYEMAEDFIDKIARESGGDIRHAITSLQYSCLKMDKCFSFAGVTHNVTQHELHSETLSSLQTSSSGDGNINSLMSLPCGRDETLSLFHALGKFLHNKREVQHASSLDTNVFALKEKFQRKPLRMDTPEKVLSQAYAEAHLVADFLHENVLDFVADDAIENAWLISSYLSDADFLLPSHLPRQFSRSIPDTYEFENIAQSIAASVAVRGALFGNSQPKSSRWHTIRSPRIWQVDQSSRNNKIQILLERLEAGYSFRFCDISCIATEYRPAIKWLHSQAPLNLCTHGNVSSSQHGIEDNTDGEDSENLERNSSLESDEDDIEDC